MTGLTREPDSPLTMERITHILDEGVRQFSRTVAVRHKQGSTWQDRTWHDIADLTHNLAAGLISRGFAKGQTAAIMANTRVDWMDADLAILLAGGVTVPVYPTTVESDCLFILDDADVQMIFVEDEEKARHIRHAYHEAGRTPIDILVLVDEEGSPSESIQRLRNEGQELLKRLPDAVRERDRKVGPEDLATIIYTSGTTGTPKGVMLTQGNFMCQCQAFARAGLLCPTDEQLIFLPLSHIFAKFFLYGALFMRIQCIFAQSFEKLADNARETRPTFMAGVPRVYEKVHEKILAKVSASSNLRRGIFSWGLRIGKRYRESLEGGKKPSKWLQLRQVVAHRLVHKPIHDAFGGRIRFLVSGGGSLGPETLEFYEAVGLTLLNGYGLTETTALTTTTLPWSQRRGTVGKPMSGVEVRLDHDGEILVRGRGVMQGYHGNADATEESMAPGGWFRTGDIGTLDGDGFLSIVDRKKEILVTSGGKNVAPQKIENLLKAQPAISNAMVYGDRRKYLVALITVDPEWQKRAEGPEAIHREVAAAIDEVNGHLPSWETVKKFHLLEEEFSMDKGELTPTLKLRRKVLASNYEEALEALYQSEDRPDRQRDLMDRLHELVVSDRIEEAATLRRSIRGDLQAWLKRILTRCPQDELRQYARFFEETRDLASAGEIHERLGASAVAADLFERGGHLDRAAKAYEVAEKWLLAARAYEASGQLAAAGRLYRRAGDPYLEAELYARHEHHQEAARLFAELSCPQRAMDMLAPVAESNPDTLEDLGLIVDEWEKAPQTSLDSAEVEDLLERCHGDPQEKASLRGRLERLSAQLDSSPSSGHQVSFHTIPIFARLDHRDLQELRDLAKPVHYPEGACLIEEGVSAPGLIVLVEGRAKVQVNVGDEEGGAPVEREIGAGDFVGDISLLDELPTSARVLALTDIQAQLLEAERFRTFLYRRRDAALEIYKVFAQTLAQRLRAGPAMHEAQSELGS